MIETIDEKHTLCGCSMADYLEHEHYMNKSWIPDDSGKQKAVKSVGDSLCVHVINGQVQGV